MGSWNHGSVSGQIRAGTLLSSIHSQMLPHQLCRGFQVTWRGPATMTLISEISVGQIEAHACPCHPYVHSGLKPLASSGPGAYSCHLGVQIVVPCWFNVCPFNFSHQQPASTVDKATSRAHSNHCQSARRLRVGCPYAQARVLVVCPGQWLCAAGPKTKSNQLPLRHTLRTCGEGQRAAKSNEVIHQGGSSQCQFQTIRVVLRYRAPRGPA